LLFTFLRYAILSKKANLVANGEAIYKLSHFCILIRNVSKGRSLGSLAAFIRRL